MNKITTKDVDKIIKESKRRFGDRIQYVLVVYDEGGPGLKFTQHLESPQIESIIGILERSKDMLVRAVNKDTIKVTKRKKKKKAQKKKKKKRVK